MRPLQEPLEGHSASCSSRVESGGLHASVDDFAIQLLLSPLPLLNPLPAASDGLAVGASALSSEPAVSLSVAAAMVVHKGPVAVGLTAYLRSAGWRPGSIHKGTTSYKHLHAYSQVPIMQQL